MKQIVSTVTTKGQVTLPVEVREHLGVNPGDRITFIVDDAGAILVTSPRYPDVASLRGAAGSLERPLPWRKVRAIAREDRLEARYGTER